jgi:hypothetical protein
VLFNRDVDSKKEMAQIASEVLDLLQMQLDSMIGRQWTDLTLEGLDAYDRRKSRIAELRSEIRRRADSKHGKSASSLSIQ